MYGQWDRAGDAALLGHTGGVSAWHVEHQHVASLGLLYIHPLVPNCRPPLRSAPEAEHLFCRDAGVVDQPVTAPHDFLSRRVAGVGHGVSGDFVALKVQSLHRRRDGVCMAGSTRKPSGHTNTSRSPGQCSTAVTLPQLSGARAALLACDLESQLAMVCGCIGL